jgi:CHAT domain-containing protein/tetratricopeptide (TPR) repeat protein
MKQLVFILLVLTTLTVKSQTTSQVLDSVAYYYQQKNYEKAIPFTEKALVFVKEKYGAESTMYTKYLRFLSGTYMLNWQFLKAEERLLEMNSINKKIAGENSKEYIEGIGVLAIVYNTMGEDDKAVPLLAEAREYYKRTAGESDPEYASASNRLAKVYESLGQYEKAVPIFIQSMEILAKTKGTNDPDYATSMNNLGIVYKNMGHPEKAEPLMLKAMEIRKKTSGEESDDYANSLNNLAVLYSGLGQHEKAENYYSKAAGIFKKTKGPTSAEYITCLTNLGSEYDMLLEYEKAEKTLLTAMTIAEKAYDENWPQRLSITKTLGQLYLATEQYSKAEPLLLKVAAVEEKKNNAGEAYAAALNDLGYLYTHSNRVTEAEKTYIRSAELTRSALGGLHNSYAATLNNLAVLYQQAGRYNEAVSILMEVNKIKEFNLLNLFAILSEDEKMNYMASNVFLQQSNLSLLYYYPAAPASFYRENYNIQLLIKSLLLTDSKNVLEAIRSSKDTVINNRLVQWQANKKALAKEYSVPEVKRRTGLTQLEAETESLEKELVRLSSGFRNMRSGIDVKMEDVQKRLGADEAAIEFVSFRLFNKEITDSIIYAAFILKKQDAFPVFVPLFEEQQLLKLTGKAGNTSRVFVNNLYPGTTKGVTDTTTISGKLYHLIWQPLEPHLQGIKKISYSPAGKLHNIAFHALATDSTSILIDHYQLRQYSSTRQLLFRDPSSTNKKPSSISLFGNATYSLDSAQLIRLKSGVQPKENFSTHLYTPGNNEMKNGIWENLAGTAEEIKKIKKLFDNNKIPSHLYTGPAASEENLKSLNSQSPQVLLIATHGFFLPEKNSNKNTSAVQGRNAFITAGDPLLRTGLILSGGNYAWSGKTAIEGVEDGIATAFEISQLNLSNTELVVLSACETALGDVKGSEGVFGLQRAFKMAGVKKMIVSLWKVPDKETSELMTSFYSFWLKGKTIDAAFAQAQAEMRKKYSPYYWAAFVLVE